ncbi:uncharacterized protein BO97DRAFT_470682 [Aspergillus homomorphus CBS 101889]|uniref:Uncharacterized protein n=1 Tax=Aspergillus homomorphus (strain CBS 101889) TaxID=1450537 RepID=A0A395HZT4_ASPHC|nr:hypothetical protein BO97DRAFT_470682 [Aspergillus homomorphus CBS 101889]RAL11784.1 hypothetical protein BO97DRAFT_470682 [Aspergillus homomorphus CBS 101889]
MMIVIRNDCKGDGMRMEAQKNKEGQFEPSASMIGCAPRIHSLTPLGGTAA